MNDKVVRERSQDLLLAFWLRGLGRNGMKKDILGEEHVRWRTKKASVLWD